MTTPQPERSDTSVCGGTLVCRGCGWVAPIDAPTPFFCPQREALPERDHVLVRQLADDPPWPETAPATGQSQPFVHYRQRLRSSAVANAHDLGDDDLVALIERLDTAVAAVDGAGFRVTPLTRAPALAAALELNAEQLWLEDETENVSGSHKARHLFGIALALEVAAAALDYRERPPLAIASCGNAALAAAVVARAADWPLSVFVPPNAAPSVLARLSDLQAQIHVCPRDGQPGDPCYRGFRAAVSDGALPFCCQGPDNGLCIEGGQTLGYELVDQLNAASVEIDVLLVQVGGGALASACAAALAEAHAEGRISRLPRLYAVQTEGAHPLERAYQRLLARHELAAPPAPLPSEQVDDLVRDAAEHRNELMWPWESEPRSIAHGILDDETYDWLAIVENMLRSGGQPLVVSEATLRRAHALLREHTTIAADPTGTAGLAGLLALQSQGLLAPGERVAILVTGHER